MRKAGSPAQVTGLISGEQRCLIVLQLTLAKQRAGAT